MMTMRNSEDVFQQQGPDGADTIKYFCSTSLLCGNHEVIILHGEDKYRLRLTRQNKLILTK